MAVNWTQVNVPTVLAVAAAAWGILSYVTDMKSELRRMEEFRVQRSQQTDTNFANVNKSIAELSGRFDAYRDSSKDLPFRVTSLERGLDETNKRVDRLSELLLNGIDALRKDINLVGTKVEVLSSKVDSAFPQRKASLERLNVPQRD